jgi:pimeloyl-ACP methyl ester carboxylesterase
MMMWLALWGCAQRDCQLVRVDGADLAVCLEGNVDSDTILLHLPGGPSEVGGWLYRRDGVRPLLAEEVRVASLDWRAMGSSKGAFGRDRVSIAQFATDVNTVVRVLQIDNPDAEVWLHGHSFGGMVGTAALLAEDSAADGWISEAGCHDWPTNAVYSSERLIEHDTVGLSAESIARWDEMRVESAALDLTTLDGRVVQNGLANEAEYLLGLPDGPSTTDQSTLAWVMGMPFQYIQVAGPGGAANGLLTEDQSALDQAGRMGEIEVPSLYLAGELDFICTRELAEDAFATVGSARTDLVVFEGGGHSFADQFPEEVSRVMLDFVGE